MLRPAPFATNALWWAPGARADGVVRLPHPDAVCPVVHEADLVHVSQAEQVAVIAEASGHPPGTQVALA
ncbi:hypothetical protein AB0H51_02315 [Streptomyces griseoluteus]|uniref:hypothetical protein n=1 Tax=Streptomyces griseoluteus TaxID=29306 RepID=UPI0033F54D02